MHPPFNRLSALLSLVSQVARLARHSANWLGGLQGSGLANLNRAVCPSAACSPQCGAKVPHAFASGFLSFGSQRIIAARLSFSCSSQGQRRFHKKKSVPRVHSSWLIGHNSIQSHKGSFGVHRSNASHQSTARFGSSASSSRPSLTWRSTGKPILGIASARPCGRPLTWR
jgi:hypothetical protein